MHLHTIQVVVGQNVGQRPQAGSCLGTNSGDGDTLHPHTENHHQEQIQQHIGDGCHEDKQ